MATKAETPMPQANADLETMWAYLEDGIDHIMTHLRDGLSYAKYMTLYTVALNYCVSSRMHGNLDSSVGLGGRTGANLMGSDLYNNLIRYFVGHLTELRNASESMVDEALLRHYAREWDSYPTGAKYVNRIFGDLNRRWVKIERNGGKNVYELALILWKRHVVKNTKLVSAVLKLIESQRNGEAIDQDLANVVKKVIDSFVLLDLDGFDTSKGSLEDYKEHFEGPFIAATEEYYDTKSAFLAGTITLPDYLKGADELLRTEDQIQFYLNANTSKIIMQKCERLFIQEHLGKMYDGFLQLLECDEVENLQRMYTLLARIPEGLEPLRKKFEEHIKYADFLQLLECNKFKDLQRMYALLVHIPEGLEPLRKKFEEHVKCAGQQAISKLVGKGSVDSLEPKVYVDALFEVRGKNERTVHQCFGGEKGFVAALDKACRDFINRNHTKLTSAVLKLIESQRNGETIDQGLVKKAIDLFVSLGLDESDTNNASLEVYFEGPFVAATEKYYKTESDTFLAENTVSDYLKRAEERLREEEDRIERYLNANTRKTLIQKCEHILIREHSEKMWGDFQQLLDYDKDEDLQRMYALLARIPEGLEPLRKKFEEHVKRAGQQAISKLVGEGGANVDSLEPKVYVDALLEVYRKNQHTVQRSFKSEMGFVAALDKACRDFVNRNAATGTSTTKSPELLAKHADALLRKSSKLAEEGELEDALNQVMVLFKHIDDKDVFQTFYTTKLSKRLIHNVSASDEAEASMISKLKDACGIEYTNKLQRMFTDMSLSKDLTDQFKEHIEQSGDTTGGDITFGIMVLGTNFWPLNAPAHEFVIPREILPTCERFTRYYQNKHTGRKLTWLWDYSTNELRTNYLNQKYILMTSSHQMGVLIQYNTNDTLSLDELISATGITKDLLMQMLGVLVKANVLINEETDQYDLNPNFRSKKIRVNLNLPIKAEVKAEVVNVLKAVDEDRKYVIQATIVRIMKTRKTLKNQALIEQVVSQISQRFTPKIDDIKKAIEMLLEREYIERAEDQRDTYNYLA